MRICLYCDHRLPALKYGGTERVVWSLGKALAAKGHEVTLLAAKGTQAPFARVLEINPGVPLSSQIPADVDIVHLQNAVPEDVRIAAEAGKIPPYVVTIHGNLGEGAHIDSNSIFVSSNHALRHGAEAFVYNGLDWDDYPAFVPGLERKGMFFLGKAAWRVKNLKGAIYIARETGERLDVLGGTRLNFKMGFRLTLDPRIHFHGMVDNEEKGYVANRSNGLIFPVRWHEPFGLAVVEAMYYGAPVFATPYGSLPELVIPSTGKLSEHLIDLGWAFKEFRGDERFIHEYAADNFNASVMADKYLHYYEEAAQGRQLNNI